MLWLMFIIKLKNLRIDDTPNCTICRSGRYKNDWNRTRNWQDVYTDVEYVNIADRYRNFTYYSHIYEKYKEASEKVAEYLL